MGLEVVEDDAVARDHHPCDQDEHPPVLDVDATIGICREEQVVIPLCSRCECVLCCLSVIAMCECDV